MELSKGRLVEYLLNVNFCKSGESGSGLKCVIITPNA